MRATNIVDMMFARVSGVHWRSVGVLVARSTGTLSRPSLGQQMKIFNQNQQFQRSLDLFDESSKKPNQPLSSLAVVQALKACSQVGDVQRAATIHRLATARIKDDPYILQSLVAFYMKCHDLDSAQKLFESSISKTVFLYGVMMKGYIDNRIPQKAIDLFHEVACPDAVIYLLLFSACGEMQTNEAAILVKKVAAQVPKDFHSHPRLLTALIDASMKCKAVEAAQSVFDQAKRKALPMYGAMLKGFVDQQMPQRAIDLFHCIEHADETIYALLCKACTQIRTQEAADLVKDIASRLPRQYHSNVYLTTSLIKALMTSGHPEVAESWFTRSNSKTIEMFGLMMKGYLDHDMPQKALSLFDDIASPNEIILVLFCNACAQLATPAALQSLIRVLPSIPRRLHTNQNLRTSLIDAFMKCGDVQRAQALFNRSETKVASTYGAIMKGYIKNQMADEALQLYNQISVNAREKDDYTELDFVIHLLAINALSQIGIDTMCYPIVERLPADVRGHQRIQIALISMWGKVGQVDEAKRIFDSLSDADKLAYTMMIGAYGLNGRCAEALELFHRVPTVLMHEPSYISVLNACSHAGFVEEARGIFQNLSVKSAKTYGAMVDCLSRGALFVEAQQLINEYEVHHPPSLQMYMALLSGARNRKKVEIAEVVYRRIKELFPESAQQLVSAAVLLTNTYASSGETDKAADTRMELTEGHVKKRVGLTWTFVDGELVKFRAHDQSHPRRDEIYAEAAKMGDEIVQHGHQYDASWVTRPLAAKETVASVLSGHSERLAIAFNFVVDPRASRIQVIQNLRMCGDCHNAIKLLAAIRRCQIIVRDTNRLHAFGIDGRCSCNDYF